MLTGVSYVFSGQIEQIEGIALHHGLPGPESGHMVAATSAFDRFWAAGNKRERFFLQVVKA